MLSFNGSPSQRGYDAVETAEYDSVQARFRFREIRFSHAAVPAAEYSEADPIRCMQCHGEPTRPVWDMSPLWPGVYGERYRSNLTGLERVGIKQFLDEQPTHPRYRQLLNAQRFAYRGTFAPDAKSEYAGEQAEPPNAEFSLLLARMNTQMIVRQLRERQDYGVYRYALLGAAEGDCGSLYEFLPATTDSQRTALERFLQTGDAHSEAQDEAKLLRAVSGTPTAPLLAATRARASRLGALRFLAETALGVSTRDWTLALEKDTYDFSVPQGPNLLAVALRTDLESSDPDIAQLYAAREYRMEDRYCEHLRKRSRSAVGMRFAGTPPSETSPGFALILPPGPQAPLQRCALCHATGAAPPLPFDRPQALAPLLRHGDYAHGDLLGEILYRLSPQAGAAHMPPNANLPSAQLEAIALYVTGLAPRR